MHAAVRNLCAASRSSLSSTLIDYGEHSPCMVRCTSSEHTHTKGSPPITKEQHWQPVAWHVLYNQTAHCAVRNCTQPGYAAQCRITTRHKMNVLNNGGTTTHRLHKQVPLRHAWCCLSPTTQCHSSHLQRYKNNTSSVRRCSLHFNRCSQKCTAASQDSYTVL